MRMLTGDESALWFVWQKQESNNWSSTAPELACLFCFIGHVKTQGSQNIIIYHPSKNIPSRQRNQSTTYYKGTLKFSLNGWRICNSRNVHINFNCADLVVKLGNNYNLYKMSILQTAIRKATTITWRKISKVTENYCNMYCCILIFVSVHRVSDFIHYQASVISDCSHNDLSSIKIAMLITSSDNYMKL